MKLIHRLNSNVLQQHPAALVRTIICSELEDCWHLIVIHLVMNVKVTLLPTTLGAATEDAPLDGADVPPTYWPVHFLLGTRNSGLGTREKLRNGATGRAAAAETLRNGAYPPKPCFLNAH
jgi:hypothetical protein